MSPENGVVVNGEQAALANEITAIDRRIDELDETQADLLDAGMKAPTPLGAGIYKRNEQSNEETRASLLEKREGLVARLRSASEDV